MEAVPFDITRDATCGEHDMAINVVRNRFNSMVRGDVQLVAQIRAAGPLLIGKVWGKLIIYTWEGPPIPVAVATVKDYEPKLAPSFAAPHSA